MRFLANDFPAMSKTATHLELFAAPSTTTMMGEQSEGRGAGKWAIQRWPHTRKEKALTFAAMGDMVLSAPSHEQKVKCSMISLKCGT